MSTMRWLHVIMLVLLALAWTACDDQLVDGTEESTEEGARADALGFAGEGGDGSGAGSGGEGGDDGTGGSDDIQAGTLTAGDVDDNLNFAAFLNYLDDALQDDQTQSLPAVQLEDRVTFRVTDADGNGLSYATVEVTSGTGFYKGYTATNGVFRLYPAFDGLPGAGVVEVDVRTADGTGQRSLSVDLAELDADRTVTIPIDGATAQAPSRLDLALIMDATGSMSDELNYLTTEFKAIVGAVRSTYPSVDMRFGLVVYRDEGDDYVVRSYDFTPSADVMQQQLAAQEAAGGGDYPEAVDQALEAGLDLQWRSGETVRLAFHIADAPPHDDKLQATLAHIKTARERGVRLYPLAGSGVAETAEYMMRIAGAVTQARYLFLTDDSGVGNPHQEPSVPCYVVTRLDQLIARVVASELAGERVEPTGDQVIRSVGPYEDGYCAAVQ